jgi:hypothetical protein
VSVKENSLFSRAWQAGSKQLEIKSLELNFAFNILQVFFLCPITQARNIEKYVQKGTDARLPVLHHSSIARVNDTENFLRPDRVSHRAACR